MDNLDNTEHTSCNYETNFNFSNFKDFLVFIIMSGKNDGKFDFVCKGKFTYHHQGLKSLYDSYIKRWYQPSITTSDRLFYINMMKEKNYIIFLNNSYEDIIVGTLYLPNIISKKQYDKLLSYKDELLKTQLIVRIYDSINHNIVNDNSYIDEEGITNYLETLDVSSLYVEDNNFYYFNQFTNDNKAKIKAM